jgi:hypothetical protein
MKKVLISLALLVVAGTASAQWHHHGGYYRGGYGGGWVAPLVIGGVIGYEINRANQPVVIQQQPQIVYTPPQPYVQAPPPGYHWQEMADPQTGVRRIVAVPN